MRPATLCSLLAAAVLAATASLGQDIRMEQVHFAPGTDRTTLTGRLVGYESVGYMLDAEAGQTMTVALEASNGATYFNVYAPGTGPGDQAIANSGVTTQELNRFEQTLEATGRYTVSVYMMRSAARRNERSDYSLDVAITGDRPERVEGDFADGMAGGPDWWRVATSGGPLNVRETPSAGGALVGQAPDGTALRNLGCRAAEGRRWCQVASASGGMTGWVAGDFLQGGAGPD
jgi:Bacterial SH3 domain